MESQIPTHVLEAAQALSQNLLASETFLLYKQAKNHMDADSNAQILLRELTKVRQNPRQTQAQETIRQADVDALRVLQAQVQANKTIMDYTAAQQEAVKFLRVINNEISQLLGMNFAVLAQKSTC